MEIVGQKVLHKALGYGVIAWYGGKEQNDKKYILVDYGSKQVEYSFPNVFEKYLKAVDPNFEKIVEEELLKIFHDKRNIPTLPTKEPKPIIIPVTTDRKSNMSVLKCKDKVKFGTICGTNSKSIYLDFCNRFGWEKGQQNNFGRQGAPLYAKGATPEGYSPWFLSHHALTQSKGGTWSNIIDGNMIYEKWDINDSRLWNDRTKRVVFAKLNGKYCFFGIFEVHEIIQGEDFKYTKTYKRISKTYPE